MNCRESDAGRRDELRISPDFQLRSGLGCPYGLRSRQLVGRAQKTKTSRVSRVLSLCQAASRQTLLTDLSTRSGWNASRARPGSAGRGGGASGTAASPAPRPLPLAFGGTIWSHLVTLGSSFLLLGSSFLHNLTSRGCCKARSARKSERAEGSRLPNLMSTED